MAILKLPNVNDTHTGHVTSCEQVTGTYGEQVRFTFASGDLLFLPVDSAHRQLLHAGFPDVGGDGHAEADLRAVGGNTLAFFRSPNKKAGAAPYWNVTIATGAPPAPSKRLNGPDTPAAPPAKVVSVTRKPQTPASQSTTTSAMAKALTPPCTRSRAQVAAAYAWCLINATAAQTAAFTKPTPDSIQAGAATLLIQLEKSGLLFEPITIDTVMTPPSQYEEPLPPQPDREDFLPF